MVMKDPWEPVITLKTMTEAVCRGAQQRLLRGSRVVKRQAVEAKLIKVDVPANWKEMAREAGLTPQEYFLMIGRALGDGLHMRGYRRSGRLPLPKGWAEGATVETPRVSVRGLSQYRIERDETVYRFDVLGWKARS